MGSRLDYSNIWDGYVTGDSTTSNQMPAYLTGADAHNYGNGNFAFTDPSTWGGGLNSAGKFIVTSVASGLNGFYNSGVAAANWFGAGLSENDVGQTLAQLDDDLGAYYKENKESVDTAGFILGSFVPGLAGVKLLQAGQKALRSAQATGAIGANLSRATGLLAPQVEAYTKLAAVDIATSQAAFAGITTNTAKAIGAGYAQAALEVAAFETAATAMQFRSPTLEDKDGWDIAKNIAHTSFVGGAIFGTGLAGINIFKAKKAVAPISKAEGGFRDVTDYTGLSPAQRIIARNETAGYLPLAPTAEEIATGAFTPTTKLLEGLAPAQASQTAEQLATKFARTREETLTGMRSANRQDIHELMAKKDIELGNYVGDAIGDLNSNQLFANFEHLTQMGRMSSVLKAEDEIAKFEKALLKGPVDLDNIPTPPARIGYVKLTGEGAGIMSFDKPKVLNLADTVGSVADVEKAIAKYKFHPEKSWDAGTVPSTLEAEARYLWSDKLNLAEVTNGMKIGASDIPLLEKAVVEKLNKIEIVTPNGNVFLETPEQILQFTKNAKEETAIKLQGMADLTTEEIAKIVNVKRTLLEGEINTADEFGDYFARQSDKLGYVNSLKERGIYTEAKEELYGYLPSYAKASYDTKNITDVDGMVLNGMSYIKSQQKLYQQGIDNVFAKHMPASLVDRFAPIEDTKLLNVTKFAESQGLFKSANATYGTLDAEIQQIGAATAAARKALKDDSANILSEHIYNLSSKPEVAIEFESINKFIQSTSEKYGINAEGTGIEPLKMIDWKAKVAAGSKASAPTLQTGAPVFVPFQNPETAAAWIARTELTSKRTAAYADMRNAQGLEDIKDVRALRPIRQDPKDYPYFAFVVDPTVTGVGHKSMIHAASEKELDALIGKVPSQYQVYKKGQLEDFYKAHGDFDWEQTLHENYIDSDLISKGVNTPFFQRTDPELIAKSLLNDHARSDDVFVREMVNAKYEKEFGFLRQQGESYTSAAQSRYTGSSYRNVEATMDNPYVNRIKTALDISLLGEHPLLTALNTNLDRGISRAWDTITSAFTSAKSPADLDAINGSLSKFGVKSAYYDAATNLLANHTAPKGVLNQFVNRGNTILATLVSKLDPLTATVNAIGSSVLYGSEVKSVMRALNVGDAEIAGELAAKLKTPIASANMTSPDADTVTSAGKLLVEAGKNFFNKESVNLKGEKLAEWYKRLGLTTDFTSQFHTVLDDLTLVGTESAEVLAKKGMSAFKLAQKLAEPVTSKLTAYSNFSEELQRFIAADTMRQITDIGVKRGLISEAEQISYMNTFVNRVAGNITASQRPLMFQGPVGQAVGLFQSYQFNMMQQLFRHVAEGNTKDAAFALGLQGTMFGMNGLPGFQYLNTHIVGMSSGNPEHNDLYSATYGAVGKSVGDLLLYGLPSNLLRGNLYSRGDINPRQVTVIPVNPLDIPIVNATAKLYDDVKASLSVIQGGGNMWNAFLQGVEHNGLSRPLAGVSQVLQGLTNGGNVYATTKTGNISGANDLFSWATAIRVAGGKPFDEAVASDAVFRVSAYQAADRNKMEELSKAVKSTFIGGETPTQEQVTAFADKYTSLGGKSTNFNKWMLKEMKEANTVKANAIVEALKHPYNQKLQQIMGGAELYDGRSFGMSF